MEILTESPMTHLLRAGAIQTACFLLSIKGARIRRVPWLTVTEQNLGVLQKVSTLVEIGDIVKRSSAQQVTFIHKLCNIRVCAANLCVKMKLGRERLNHI